ncbi:thiosulfate/3-mercaptopyruvate sulfurtransferase [Micromonospora phaseoli]|uniref:Thiosulfate/3-mercaptopyruvate sulfurtransferase n=1 Tax=Micromonospora phaseoli TaxID=1144548 RepID=A0A1H6RPJ3_9ACTN|nr:sulfurtransferase [Micromonospora phaseoli]PZW03599.1 thiosulfate/3-mercaptopyruvate sulfurtransferase [Micromonospora phaseoli]GIJ77166.1 sulfurtransferase [Micromonospora phaseoli]SEI57689.1 thiosulfate/3-mercaptopyruvate sulfurtransferase [Micromonospora phaseoli]
MSGTEDLLVEAEPLAAEIGGADPPTLLDVRWRLTGPPGRDDYAVGHLPGAVFVDLDTALCGPPGPAGRHPLPDPAALQAALRAAGVRAGHPVVVYDGGDGMSAARAWWTLRWAGHRPVRLLSGGFPAWIAAGLPTSTDEESPRPGDVIVAPGALPVLDAAAAARLAAADGVLLDVRAAPRYRGEHEPVDPVAGHIPGAVNLPAPEYVAAGRFPAAEALRDRFAAAGVTDAVPVGAYCGSGVTAAQAVLALHLAGRTDVALYVGSWSNWVADPGRPVATGPAPDA